MLDKEKLLERVEQSIRLESNWDGFGTEPTKKTVALISKQIIENAPESFESIRYVTSVEPLGGAEIELHRFDRKFVFFVNPSTPIEWEEHFKGKVVATGSFWYTDENLLGILKL